MRASRCSSLPWLGDTAIEGNSAAALSANAASSAASGGTNRLVRYRSTAVHCSWLILVASAKFPDSPARSCEPPQTDGILRTYYCGLPDSRVIGPRFTGAIGFDRMATVVV